MGYIFNTGQFAVWPRCDGAYPFDEGLGMIKVGRGTGYIDKTGRFIRGL
ncbi:MAG TPA: WG repeat-containing protein [Thermodesulfobacteriota bacterium]|nr:WG repeat-containing protein [Thermodesulfobacteriota bacterium]